MPTSVASGFHLRPSRTSTTGLAPRCGTEMDRRHHQRFGTTLGLSEGEGSRRVRLNSAAVFMEDAPLQWDSLRVSRKLGPVHTPEHPLIKPQSRAKIFLPLSGLSTLKFQNQTQKNSTKEFHLSCSQSIPVVCS